jgi:hypothetical protein
MLSTFAHFAKVRAMPGRKKSFVEGFKAAATTGKRTANCCTAVSCLSAVLTCGCCCKSCVRAGIETGDVYRTWLDFMSVYDGIPAAATDRIFCTAMDLLKNIEQQLTAILQAKQSALQETNPALGGTAVAAFTDNGKLLFVGNTAERVSNAYRYRLLSYELEKMSLDYRPEKWLHTFLDNVMMYATSRTPIDYISLSDAELSVIYAAMPMFYMALAKDRPYGRSISDMERKIIEHHVRMNTVA